MNDLRWAPVSCVLVSFTAACSWTVPAPRVMLDASGDHTAVGMDVVAEATVAPDSGVDAALPRDLPGPMDAADATTQPDLPSLDSGSDMPLADLSLADTSVDLGVDVAMPRDTQPMDVTASDEGVDVPVIDGACNPGDTRACYDGTSASENVGACRDGVQTCSAMGVWSGCTGEIVPDCESRTCGSDECGGSCGDCPSGMVCDDSGQCITLACGAAQFTVTCSDDSTCPVGSTCAAGDTCDCNAGYIAVDCNNDPCAPCTYPDWVCVPSPFCGAGEVICASGAHCPRHSSCDPVSGACVCNMGYTATTCAGTHCTACTGTDYQCMPLPLPG